MENRINVAELLKYCPKGMELDCTMYEGAELKGVTNIKNNYPIEIIIKDNINGNIEISLTKEGYYNMLHNPKCVIFPKGKTTWEGFVPPCKFKDGDVLTENSCIFIIQKLGDNNTAAKTYCTLYDDGIFDDGTILYFDIDSTKHATKEEKQKLFDAIKDNGYKWNPKTKTLEKLVEPKFKVGDKVKLKLKPNYVYTIHSLTWDDNKQLAYRFLPNNDKHLRLVSLKAQDDYELIPNKFDITTLVPFESRVLVRAEYNQFWRPAIWGVKHEDWDFCCVVGGEMWEQCIPYEGNEHLLGTTDDCDEFYKTWEQ